MKTTGKRLRKQLILLAAGIGAAALIGAPALASSTGSYILGDVDGNGAVNSADVTVLKQYVANMGVEIDATAS
ncbi:MAG: dockerin type I domain-containing protein, partial [Clostridiales bacterium]|nr:dockerin type I domain-containing protein [Clostridiales bacterium]